jgi:hypothetical protein
MPFMTSTTWTPKERDEVIRRRAEEGPMIPEGMKVLGEWVQVGANRVFRLVEVTNARLILAAVHPWADLTNVETFPVMEVEEVMKLIPKG